MRKATNIASDKLISFGTCFGKFSKTLKFRLHVTALTYLGPYAEVCLLKFGHLFFSSRFGLRRLRNSHSCMATMSKRTGLGESLTTHRNIRVLWCIQ